MSNGPGSASTLALLSVAFGLYHFYVGNPLLGLAALFVGFVVGVVAMVGSDAGETDGGGTGERPAEDAIERLRLRFAEGDLSEEEFERKLDRLREDRLDEDGPGDRREKGRGSRE